MKQVTIRKDQLLEILKKNREDHIAIHTEAFEKFKSRLAGELERLLEEVAKGRIPDYQRAIAQIEKPENHTKEYDRAIKMLELEVGDTVVISSEQFASLVEDEWNWSERWAFSNRTYTRHEKVTKFLGGD